MEYLSAKEVAALWGISERSVRNYCTQGRVDGARLVGKTWGIPASAQKPERANAKTGSVKTYASPLLARLREEKQMRLKGSIYHKVQVELTYNSNHIEGSRLSFDQTRLIFETATLGVQDEAIPIDDIVETANHFRCIDYIIDHAGEPLTSELVKELHRMLKAATTDSAKDWFAMGDWKKLPNEVGGQKTVPPKEVDKAMRSLLNEYRTSKPVRHSFDDLLDFHVQFEQIHPFQDGNGRVGRLILFKECLANGHVPFVISDDMKLFYYRGLREWDEERGYLRDTCLAAQDAFAEWMKNFEIPQDAM